MRWCDIRRDEPLPYSTPASKRNICRCVSIPSLVHRLTRKTDPETGNSRYPPPSLSDSPYPQLAIRGATPSYHTTLRTDNNFAQCESNLSSLPPFQLEADRCFTAFSFVPSSSLPPSGEWGVTRLAAYILKCAPQHSNSLPASPLGLPS
jgi:hypothetical protein